LGLGVSGEAADQGSLAPVALGDEHGGGGVDVVEPAGEVVRQQAVAISVEEGHVERRICVSGFGFRVSGLGCVEEGYVERRIACLRFGFRV
jgi:hypothetical protein